MSKNDATAFKKKLCYLLFLTLCSPLLKSTSRTSMNLLCIITLGQKVQCSNCRLCKHLGTLWIQLHLILSLPSPLSDTVGKRLIMRTNYTCNTENVVNSYVHNEYLEQRQSSVSVNARLLILPSAIARPPGLVLEQIGCYRQVSVIWASKFHNFFSFRIAMYTDQFQYVLCW